MNRVAPTIDATIELNDRRRWLASAASCLFAIRSLRSRGLLARHLLRKISDIEGGEYFSPTAREILNKYYRVTVGPYGYGACMKPGTFPAGVSVGRYVSIAHSAVVTLQNKPVQRVGMHPLFYEGDSDSAHNLAYDSKLRIEHDAWIGERATILPGCSRIGIGAVIGAGAIVTRDVPDFGVAVGNPARVIKYRFDAAVQQALLSLSWWSYPYHKLSPYIKDLNHSANLQLICHLRNKLS